MSTVALPLENEQTILARAKVDPGAFAALYQHYYPAVYRYVAYRLHDSDAAQDVTSLIFEKALTNLASHDPSRGSFRVWIFGIARNTVNKHIQREKLSRWIPLESILHNTFADAPAIEEVLTRRDTLARLLALLPELDQRQRDILALKFGGGLTNKLIAQLTGLSVSNVGVILYRTLRRLRDRLQEEETHGESVES